MERGTSTVLSTLREQILAEWSELDEGDITAAGGSLDKLTAVIARKSGQRRADVKKELLRLFAGKN